MDNERFAAMLQYSYEFYEYFNDIEEYMYENDVDKGMALVSPFIRYCEVHKPYESDGTKEYVYLFGHMEELLYARTRDPQKEVVEMPVNIAEAYDYYAQFLSMQGRHNMAEHAYAHALKWRPVDAALWQGYAMTFRQRGMYDEFDAAMSEAFHFAFTSEAVGICYMYKAVSFMDREKYLEAACCCLMGRHFLDVPQMSDMMERLKTEQGIDADELDGSTVQEVLETLGMSLPVSEDVLQSAYQCGMDAYESGDSKDTRYFLGLVDHFVDDDEVKRILEELGPEEEIEASGEDPGAEEGSGPVSGNLEGLDIMLPDEVLGLLNGLGKRDEDGPAQ